MSIEVKVPQLPESVADATLVAWHKKAGDAVRREENLVDLETDKVVLEVPAPVDGVIREIVASDGAVVTSGQLLAILEPGAAAAAAPPVPAAKDKAPPPAAKAAPPPKAAPEPAPRAPAAPAAVAAAPAQARSSASANKMGPAVRKLVEEHDLDPGAIAGSGREGRITKGDVLDYIADHQATTVGIEHDVMSRAGVSKPPAPQPASPGVSRNEHRVAMTRLRARIAERLLQAQQQAAMLTTFNEVDMTAVMALRQRYQEPFTAKHGIKLGFMSFFVKASVEALRQFPVLNASVDGNDIIYHEFFDVGVAVSTDRGLVVPVLRNAEAMGFGVIEQTIRDFGERARKGSLQMEELTGGTFTITNGGIFGSLMSTPILNPPQSGILGMHKIQERPVVVGGKVEARPMMYLALTYDHRIVDGREAVQFLVHVKDLLEDPARLLLEI
ncbi:MAG TPA: 2-oxoglutarate dehydrogenase complex dihydrolipoyllysine-residue succinyltransferase [Gammaproteobacteria bacterium]